MGSNTHGADVDITCGCQVCGEAKSRNDYRGALMGETGVDENGTTSGPKSQAFKAEALRATFCKTRKQRANWQSKQRKKRASVLEKHRRRRGCPPPLRPSAGCSANMRSDRCPSKGCGRAEHVLTLRTLNAGHMLSQSGAGRDPTIQEKVT